ncbi:hypothetical protein GIB67_042184, partial [Kingdonia uniflora]
QAILTLWKTFLRRKTIGRCRIARQLNNLILKQNYKNSITYRLDMHIPWLPLF